MAAGRLDLELGSEWHGADPKLRAALVASRQANFRDALRWMRFNNGPPQPPLHETEQAIQLWVRSGLTVAMRFSP